MRLQKYFEFVGGGLVEAFTGQVGRNLHLCFLVYGSIRVVAQLQHGKLTKHLIQFFHRRETLARWQQGSSGINPILLKPGFNFRPEMLRRSVMIADDDGAYVYAVSTGGISVAEIVEGLPEVATVPFLSADDPMCPTQNVPL